MTVKLLKTLERKHEMAIPAEAPFSNKISNLSMSKRHNGALWVQRFLTECLILGEGRRGSRHDGGLQQGGSYGGPFGVNDGREAVGPVMAAAPEAANPRAVP